MDKGFPEENSFVWLDDREKGGKCQGGMEPFGF
jgi:hypothetical protein